MKVQFEQKVVEDTADIGKQRTVLHNAVKLVAMEHQIFLTVRGFMNGFRRNVNTIEIAAGIVAKRRVMIARKIGYPGAMRSLVQNQINNSVVDRRPVPSFFELPEIKNVSDEIRCSDSVCCRKSYS